MAGKFGRGEDFTFEDFLAQMESVRKMGSIGSCSGCCRAWARCASRSTNIDERESTASTAIIQSMTPAERREPQDPQRLAAVAHRPRLRSHGRRRQRAGRAVLRGAEDDAPDGRRWRDARHAGHAGHARRGRGKKAKGKAGQEGARAKRRPVRQPGQAAAEHAAAEAAAADRQVMPKPGRAARRPSAARGASSSTRPPCSSPTTCSEYLKRR